MSESSYEGGKSLSALFGITPEESESLLRRESPEDQLAVEQVVSMLKTHLLPERLPTIVHEPAEAYGGLSIVESLAQDPRATLEAVQTSFGWSDNA